MFMSLIFQFLSISTFSWPEVCNTNVSLHNVVALAADADSVIDVSEWTSFWLMSVNSALVLRAVGTSKKSTRKNSAKCLQASSKNY